MSQELEKFNDLIKAFNIKANCISYNNINNYYSYDLVLEPGEKLSNIKRVLGEISLNLKAGCKPTMQILFDQGLIRLEFLPRQNKSVVLSDLLDEDPEIPPGNEIPCILGKTHDGQPVWMDIAKNPNLIIAGTTGSGKSVLLNNIIYNLYRNTNSTVFLIDPKNVEFSKFYGVERTYVGHTYKAALSIVEKLNVIMNKRYLYSREVISELDPLILIIDEFASLILDDNKKVFYNQLCLLSQKCRAAKIHIIIATQRPSTDVISGVIKANFPARIACRVSSHVDSKVILDQTGAEDLLGSGDAIMKTGTSTQRFQVAYC